MNILQRADSIVNARLEENHRNYGDFNESMQRMANIFNALTGHNLSVKDMFIAMVALKFSRESFSHKEDNLLDAVAYIGALNNYLNS
jgi:hypothetical protein